MMMMRKMMITVALSLSMRKVLLLLMMELLVVDALLALVRTMRQAR